MDSASRRVIPAAYVAGDFYDFIPLAGGGVLIVIADVAGKGVAAGLMMATVKAVLPLLAAADRDPASGRMSVANAGLPDPLVIAPDSTAPRAVVVTGPRYPAGIRSPLAYQATTVMLAAGERVLF